MAIKRILHFQGRMGKGGAEIFMMNVYRYIDRSNYQFDFLIYDDYQDVRDYEEEISRLGGRIFVVTNPKKNIIKYLREVNSLLKKEKFDIVHNQVYFGGGLNLKLARRNGVKKRIAHSHATKDGKGENFGMRILRVYFKHLLLKNATDLVACSSEAGVSLFGENTPFKVVHNGIDLELFRVEKKKKHENRERIGLAKSDFVVGNIGRMEKQKNQDFLIDIFESVLVIQPDAKLVLVGNGSLRDSILRKVKDKKLESKVLYLGEREDMPQLLSTMDVFVLSSLYEGLPTVAVEAQAALLKLVLTDTISKETSLTPNVSYMGLDEPLESWASAIVSSPLENSYTPELGNYDYRVTAPKMCDIYDGK